MGVHGFDIYNYTREARFATNGLINLGPNPEWANRWTPENENTDIVGFVKGINALTPSSQFVEKGDFVAIMGDSGSGKTTLLNILATLDKPTSGDVLLDGKSLGHLSDKEISTFRRKNLGFVFQDFNLLDTFSLRDNIYLPLVLAGEDYREMGQIIRPIAQALHIYELLE